MAGMQSTLALNDQLSGPLMRMMRAMESTINVMERMDQATNNIDTRALARARRDIQNASADLERLMSNTRNNGPNIDEVADRFSNLPPPINSATNAVQLFFASFAGAAAAYLSIQGLINGFQTFVNASDNFISTNARLELINDQLQTQAELQDKVYQAAQRSRTGYNDLAGSVAKLNLLAEDAFSGNDEAIRFGELMGKAFTVSGASTQERQAGMYQLTQAMAAGKLQGDEFRSIMENAPLLAQAIADATGKSKGDLKEMSAEGTITADIIKAALFKAADDIEAKFKSMPLTFGQAMTMFSNWAIRAFEPLFVRFNQFVNSDAFGVLAGHAMVFVNIMISSISAFFDLLEWGYVHLGGLGSLIADNWSVIAPYLTIAGGVLTGYLGIMAALGISTGIAAVSQWALNTAVSFQAAASMAAAGATFTQTAAQHGLNAAIYAFPGTWILLAFVAVIALVVYALYAWGDQTAAVIDFIAGLFTSLVAGVYNKFAFMWNILVSFAEFLVNVFIDPVYAVKKLFYDLGMNFLQVTHNMALSVEGFAGNFVSVMYAAVNKVLGAVNGLVGALNKIPGFDIPEISLINEGSLNVASSKISNMMSALEKMKPVSTKGVVDFGSAKLDQINLHSAFLKGDQIGKKLSNSATKGLNSIVDKAKGLLGGKGNGTNLDNPFQNLPTGLDNPLGQGNNLIPANPTGGKLDKIGKIDDEINIAEEDLKVLRELAERKSIQNIVTLTPTVKLEGTIVREEADINKIIEKAETIWNEKANEMAEGVFE